MRLFDRPGQIESINAFISAMPTRNSLTLSIEEGGDGARSDNGIVASNDLKATEIQGASIAADNQNTMMDCANTSHPECKRPKEVELTSSPTTPAQIEALEAVKCPHPAASRRNLLKATTGLAGMQLVRGLAGPKRDCQLIRLCEEFGELERTSHDSWDYENQEFWSALLQRQQSLADKICDLRPTTLEGLRALARAVTGWSHNMQDEEFEDMNGRDEQLFGFLMRSLVEVKS